MNKLITTVIVFACILAIVGLSFVVGPFYVIKEGEQAVVIRFGQIVNEVPEAGLKLKTPFVDNVVRYSKKILSWDGDPRRVPTSENQFIWIDTTARWKINDPSKFYSSVTTMERAYSRLDDIIESAVRTVIAENNLREAVRNSNIINTLERKGALSSVDDPEDSAQLEELIVGVEPQTDIEKGRRLLSQEMFTSAIRVTPDFGIELIDIVIRQIRYSEDLTESVYNRMISERNRIAQAHRSFGEGRKQEWFGQLENEKRSILSRAYETAETIRGEADAEASTIYAAAYNRNLNFFELWRAIESYRSTLPKFNKTLTTDMEYFRFLYDQNGQ